MATKCPRCDSDNTSDSKFCKECGTQLLPSKEALEVTKTLVTSTPELTRGTLFAKRYEIIEELGTGGMGKVYRVEDKKTKEEIALKIIKSEIAADKKTIERFRNELTTARKIRHKNICGMYDLGEDKGSYYITMEYVSGEDLKSLLRRVKQIPIGTAISISKQICDGLSEAHQLGIVHRDLKPSNIMIDKAGNARIMDFGIARSITEKGITDRGVMIGTPEYLSPEQAETREVDHRSDIYSLGVILYEMVTGKRPFEGETALSVARKHADEIPREPKEINPQISDDLNGVILKCLEKDKERRYQSSGELKTELEKIESGIPTTDREIPKKKALTSKEITVTLGLKKLLIPTLIFIAIVIVGSIIWRLLPEKEVVPAEPVKPSVAVLPFTDLSPQKDQGYLCDGFAESLINALINVQGLRVTAPTSSFSFRGKKNNIRDIGEMLDVKTVLRGSLQRAGNKVGIIAQLINVEDESLLWSEQYNRKMDDVFAIQEEINLAIVDKLEIVLLGGEKGKLVKRYTENPKAYNLYLQGRYFWKKRTEADMEKGIGYFEEAINADPVFALAYAGLADSYILLAAYGGWEPKKAYSEARIAALKALERDGMLAEAHTSLAAVKFWHDWDWKGAERGFKRAIEFNKSYVLAHQWYAELLKSIGRIDDAIAEVKIALELDPISLQLNKALGDYLMYARQYDEAINQLHKTLEMDPDFPGTRSILGKTYLLKGMYKQAVEMIKETGSVTIVHAFMAMGDKDKAFATLQDLKRKSSSQYVDPYNFAIIYMGLGEIDLTFEALERAYQERSNYMVDYIYIDPLFDRIRSDSRFMALLEKMNLE